MKSHDDVYKTPGAFSWSELMTSDPQGASTFYSQLFGWKIEAGEDKGMGPYHHIEVDGTEVSEARWFSRADLRGETDAGIVVPAGVSISSSPMESWLGRPLTAGW